MLYEYVTEVNSVKIKFSYITWMQYSCKFIKY